MLSTSLLGMNFKNPTILASGILGVAGSSLKRAAEFGAGGVVTKSIGVEPREGHKNPTVVELEFGLLNAMGLSNPGYREFKDEIEVAKGGGVPLIGSVFGFSTKEFVEVAKALEGYGVDALELNLSCPNVNKAGLYYGRSEELSREVVKAVKDSVKVPVIAKLSGVTNIVEVAKACEEGGCDGITAINTVRGTKIDILAKTFALGNKFGGLSGPCIKPIALYNVYELAREVDIPIIGCGGISTGEDAIEFLMVGARLVQIGTVVLGRGITVFKKVSSEIEKFMKENGYQSLDELIGVAL